MVCLYLANLSASCSMRFVPVIYTCVIIFSGCATMKPAIVEKGDTKIDPVKFFIGRTHSSGVIENPGGKPKIRITTETMGIIKDSIIYIEQDLYPEGEKKNHRTFKLRQTDEHHVEATADDIAGTAQGLLFGNEFSWTFRRKLEGRKIIRHVRMSQNFYLMPGGKTMIIRSVIRKFGFVVAQITEQFSKE